MAFSSWSFVCGGGRRASMTFSSFHMMSISTSCSSHVSFERSCHTWPKFIQIQNVVHYVVHLWKWKDLSAVSRKFFWSVEIEQPLLVAKLTRAEINGLSSLSLCVAAAEPPWNSLHSIWCPSPLPALHMFLLKYLVILDPNSSNSKRSALRSATYENGKTCRRSHASFSEASRLNSLCWLQSWHGLR